jgi:plastocyanin
LALGTLVLGACAKGEDTTIATSPTAKGRPSLSSAPSKESNHGQKNFTSKDFTAELELDNDGSDYYFKPTVFKGPGGGTATLELQNEGDVEHNFSIDGLHIDQDLEKGAKKTVTVQLGDATRVDFYCKYHKALGMRGHFDLN